MANANYEYRIGFIADTSQLKQGINSARAELQKLGQFQFNKASTQGLTTELRQGAQAANELRLMLDQATNVNTGKLDLSRFRQQMQASGKDVNYFATQLNNLGPEGQAAFRQVASAVSQAEAPMFRISNLASKLWTTLSNTMRWQISATALNAFSGALQSAFRYSQDLNESLNNIRIVTGASVAEMKEFAKEANSAAKRLSTTTTDYTDASLIYYQQGLSDEEVLKRTETTIKMANTSRQSAEEVSNQLTAIWNNFYDGTKSLEYYADVITELGAATASSQEEIATGLEKFAAIAGTVGLSYEYATSALATVTAATRQSAEVVGTAFKTLFSRLEGLSLGETLDDGVTLNKYSEALATVGVNILDANGNLKAMDDILDELGEKWNDLNQAQQVALATTVGGVRQYTTLISLMENWDEMQINVSLAEGSEGTLQEQADIYADSWEAATNRITAAVETIWQTLIDDEAFIGLIDAGGAILEFINQAIQGLGGAEGLLLYITSIVTTLFQKQIANGLSNVIYSIQSIFGITQRLNEQTREQWAKTQMINESQTSLNAAKAAEVEINQQITGLMDRANAIESKHLNLLKESVAQQVLYMEGLEKSKALNNDIIQKSYESITQVQRKDSMNDLNDYTTLQSWDGLNDVNSSTQYVTGLKESPTTFMGNITNFSNLNEASGALKTLKQEMESLSAGFEKGAVSAAEFQQRYKILVADAKKGGKLNLKLNLDGKNIASDIKLVSQAEQDVSANAKNLKTSLTQAIQGSTNLSQNLRSELLEALNSIDVNSEEAGQKLAQLAVEFSKVATADPSAKLRQARQEIFAVGQTSAGVINTITSLASVISTISYSITSLTSISQAWTDVMNGEMDAGEALQQTLMMLPMALQILTVLKQEDTLVSLAAIGAKKFGIIITKDEIINTNAASTSHIGATISKWAEKVATDALNGSLGATLLLLAPLVLGIAAVIGVVLILVKCFSDAKKQAEYQAKEQERLAKTTEELKSAYTDLKDEIEKVNEAFEKLTDMNDNLKTLQKGTEAWAEQFANIQEYIKQLAIDYPELLQNGIISITGGEYVLDEEKYDSYIASLEQEGTYDLYASFVTNPFSSDQNREAGSLLYSTPLNKLGYGWVNQNAKITVDQMGRLTKGTHDQGEFKASLAQALEDSIKNELLATGWTEARLNELEVGKISDFLFSEDRSLDQQPYADLIRAAGGEDLINDFDEAVNAYADLKKAYSLEDEFFTDQVANNYAGLIFSEFTNADTQKLIANQMSEVTGQIERESDLVDDLDVGASSYSKNSLQTLFGGYYNEIWNTFAEATDLTEYEKNSMSGIKYNEDSGQWEYSYIDEISKTTQIVTLEYVESLGKASQAVDRLTATAQKAEKAFFKWEQKYSKDSNTKTLLTAILTSDVSNIKYNSSDKITDTMVQTAFEDAEYTNEQILTTLQASGIGTNLTIDDVSNPNFDWSNLFSQYGEVLQNDLTEQRKLIQSDSTTKFGTFDEGQVNNTSNAELISLYDMIDTAVLQGSKESGLILQKIFNNQGYEALSGIDWKNVSVEDMKTNFSFLAAETPEVIQKLIDVMASSVDTSIDSLQKLKNAEEVVKDLNVGDVIDNEAFSTLGEEAKDYFIKMSDGTYMLVAAAEKFLETSKRATFEELLDAAESKENAYNDFIQSIPGEDFAFSRYSSAKLQQVAQLMIAAGDADAERYYQQYLYSEEGSEEYNEARNELANIWNEKYRSYNEDDWKNAYNKNVSGAYALALLAAPDTATALAYKDQFVAGLELDSTLNGEKVFTEYYNELVKKYANTSETVLKYSPTVAYLNNAYNTGIPLTEDWYQRIVESSGFSKENSEDLLNVLRNTDFNPYEDFVANAEAVWEYVAQSLGVEASDVMANEEVTKYIYDNRESLAKAFELMATNDISGLVDFWLAAMSEENGINMSKDNPLFNFITLLVNAFEFIGTVQDAEGSIEKAIDTEYPGDSDSRDMEDLKKEFSELTKSIDHLTAKMDGLAAARDRAFGADKLAIMQQEIATGKSMTEMYRQMAQAAAQVYDEKRKALEEKFNSGIFNENGTIKDNAVDEILKDSKGEELLTDYYDAWNKYQESNQSYLESIWQVQDTLLESITEDFELKINVLEMQKAAREFSQTIAESLGDDLDKVAKQNKHLVENIKAIGDSYAKEYASYLTDLQEQLNNPFANQAEVMSEIESLQGDIISHGEELLELVEELEQALPNALDAARKRFEQFTKQLEHSTTVLDTIKELYELQGLSSKTEAGYAKLQEISQEKLNAAITEAQMHGRWYDEMSKRLVEANNRLAEAEEGTQTYDILRTARDALLEEYNQSQEAMLSSAKEALEIAKAMYEEELKKAAQDFENAMTDNMGFDYLQNKYDNYIKQEERYLDAVNASYEMSKINRKLDADIQKASSNFATAKLKSLQKEINLRAESNKLSKYDLDIMNARYELTLKEIALEEAQNAKTSMRLQRDNQGNWGYVYTANQDNISKAEQEVEDLQNKYYNLAKDRVTDVFGEITKYGQEFNSDFEEILTKYNNDLTSPEAQREIEDLITTYTQDADFGTIESRKALADLEAAGVISLEDFKNTYGEDMLAMVSSTENFEQKFKEYLNSVIDSSNNYKDTTEEIADKVGVSYTDLEAMLQKVNQANKDIEASSESAMTKMFDMIPSIETLAETYGKLADEIMGVVSQLENLANQTSNIYASGASGDFGGIVSSAKVDKDGNISFQDQGGKDLDLIQVLQNNGIKLDQTGDFDLNGSKATFSHNGSKWEYDLDTRQLKQITDEIPGVEEDEEVLLEDEYKEIEGYLSSDGKRPTYISSVSIGNLQYQWDPVRQEVIVYNEEGKKIGSWTPTTFDTGGYTGAFQGGRLAMLHEKELVLNKTDTEKILAAVDVARTLDTAILGQLIAALDGNASASLGLMNSHLTGNANYTPGSNDLNQHVEIQANFPGVQSAAEIELALNNLVNKAAQYASLPND